MKKSRIKILQSLIIFVACLTMIFPTRQIWGQSEPPSDDQVNQIAEQLYCPVCENVPLDECTTAACQQWRELIRQRLAQGWTEEEIKDYFVAQYGDKVLGEPPRRGLNWLLYLFPPLIFLLGLALMVTKFKHSHKAVDNVEDIDPYLLQVERDLEDKD